MQIKYIKELSNINDINKLLKRNVTIGFFDALHLGHQHIITKLANEQTNNLKSVITFDEHPFKKLITPLNQKIDKLSELNIDEVIVILMSEKIKQSTATDFIKFLKVINTEKIIIGNDFKFGYKQEGNVDLLKDNFNVETVPFVSLNNQKISSTNIRDLLEQGKVSEIKELTGKSYHINGEVIHGDEIGRTIDFPTANIITENYVPAFGVYHTRTMYKNKTYESLTNIGVRPTINKGTVSIETYILDFNEQIYGEQLNIEFIKFIRPEQKFESLEQLKVQIDLDKKKIITAY